jgi:hypothetical protein
MTPFEIAKETIQDTSSWGAGSRTHVLAQEVIRLTEGNAILNDQKKILQSYSDHQSEALKEAEKILSRITLNGAYSLSGIEIWLNKHGGKS